MTVYVDNFRTPASVGRILGRWSHLTANTPEELHQFANRLGLRREWFQGVCKYTNCPTIKYVGSAALEDACVHFHYDVTDGKRDEAIGVGATPIDVRDMGALVSLRRRQYTFDPERYIPEPCQPIGCDNGYHLPGCWYSGTDATEETR